MAEAADIINSTMNSSKLSSGSHVIRGSHAIGDVSGMRLYIQNIPDDKIRQNANRNLSKLLEEQRAKAESRNEIFNHNFVAYNYNHASIELLTKEQAAQYLQEDSKAESNTAEITTGTAAAGAGLSLVDRNFLKHNPVANTIPGDSETQPKPPLSLTLSAEEIENGAGQEYYTYWAEAKNDGIAAFDPNIFKGPLSEDALITNKSFQNAAQILYDNEARKDGEPLWSEHALANGWSKEVAAEKLGQWGHDHMHDFNYDTFSGIGVARDSKNGGRDVQLATLYMMQAYDHKSVTLGSFGSAAWTAVTDPVNVGFLLLGIAGAAFTGGGSLVAAGAGVAARQTAGMAARKAAMALIGDSVKKNIARGVIGGAVESYLDDRYVRFEAEKGGFKALGNEEKAEYTLQRGATNTAIGAVIGGGITSLPHGVKAGIEKFTTYRKNSKADQPADMEAEAKKSDAPESDAEDSTTDATPKDKTEAAKDNETTDAKNDPQPDSADTEDVKVDEAPDEVETPQSNDTPEDNAQKSDGTVIYGHFNHAAQGKGNGASSAQPHQGIPQQILDAIARGDAVEYTDGNTSFKVGQNSSASDAQTRTTTGKKVDADPTPKKSASRTSDTGTNANSNGSASPAPPTNTGESTAGKTSTNTGQTPYNSVHKGVKDPDLLDIEKPAFDPQVDRLQWLARRSFNPLTAFSHITPVAAYQVRSVGNTRPVITAIDKQFQDLSLVGKMNGDTIEKGSIQKMQDEILDALEAGDNPDLDTIMEEFLLKNKTALEHLQATTAELRKHVEDTYGYKDPETGKIFGSNTSTKLYGLTPDQRDALLKYIDGKNDLAHQLAQGVDGTIFQEIKNNVARIQNGEFTAYDVRHSATGLSRADYESSSVFARQEDRWATKIEASSKDLKDEAKTNATMQFRKIAERDIDNGFVNNNPHTAKPMSYLELATENTEEIWMNQILKYAKRDENGTLDIRWDTKVTGDQLPTFMGLFETLHNRKQSGVALSALTKLKRLAQADGSSKTEPAPTEAMVRSYFEKKEAYHNDPSYKEFADRFIAIAAKDYGGAAKKKWFGIHAKFMEDNRPNRHAAEKNMYFAEYWTMFENTKRSALRGTAPPGQIHIDNKFKIGPLKKIGGYLAGADKTIAVKSTDWGTESKDFGLTKVIWNKEDENAGYGFANVRKGATRILSAGLMDDLSLNPFKMPSKLGWTAVGGGLTWGAGEFLEYEAIADSGEFIFDAGTIIADPVYGGVYSLFDSVTPAEALELINENPEYDSYIEAEKSAAAAVMAEKDDDDEANVESYLEAARKARLEKALQGKREIVQTANNTDDGGQADDEPEVRDSNYSHSFKKASEKVSNISGSLGSVFSGVVEGAFPNSGISEGISGVFNWVGNTFSDLKNNRIKNGTDILGYGAAALASLMILPKIGERLGFLNFGGLTTLLLGFLAIGYGGRFVGNMFEGQGAGNALPKALKNLSSDSSKNEKTKEKAAPETKIVVEDTLVKKARNDDEIYFSDEDGDGEKEVKLKDISINSIAGQSSGKVVNVPSMMKIVTGVAANDAEAYLNNLERSGRVVHAREMGKFAGADNFEGGAEAIDIKTGQVISLHSLTGKIDDPNLIAIEHREAS